MNQSSKLCYTREVHPAVPLGKQEAYKNQRFCLCRESTHNVKVFSYIKRVYLSINYRHVSYHNHNHNHNIIQTRKKRTAKKQPITDSSYKVAGCNGYISKRLDM